MLNTGTVRALPATEVCGRLSHDSLYAEARESNRIPTWCGGMLSGASREGKGGGVNLAMAQGRQLCRAGGCSKLRGPSLATLLCSSLPFWQSHGGHCCNQQYESPAFHTLAGLMAKWWNVSHCSVMVAGGVSRVGPERSQPHYISRLC